MIRRNLRRLIDRFLLEPARRFIQIPLEARLGPLRQRARHRAASRRIPTVEQALRNLGERWELGDDDPPDRPIFILSAGWRSGSTLLQRLVMSGGNVIVWGEPYAYCAHVQRLAASLRPFTTDYPPDQFFLHERDDLDREEFWEQWIANLYPHPAIMRRAHRDFFRSLYARPAHERGFSRWALKEVRLGIQHAQYLRWLFPESQFLFLIRNPYDAYRSYRPIRRWYDRWPERPVFTPRAFGEHWRKLASGFLRESHKVDGRLIRYEELSGDGFPLDRLSEHLKLDLKENVLSKRVKGLGPKVPEPVPGTETRILQRAVDPTAAGMGYRPR